MILLKNVAWTSIIKKKKTATSLQYHEEHHNQKKLFDFLSNFNFLLDFIYLFFVVA